MYLFDINIKTMGCYLCHLDTFNPNKYGNNLNLIKIWLKVSEIKSNFSHGLNDDILNDKLW